MNERRRHPRQPVRILVQHTNAPDDALQIDYARDLSPGGLFIASRAKVAPNATLHVQFSPSRDSRMVHAFCRVARVTEEGFGAQFVSLDLDAHELIAAALN
jgi:hypothetical protein